MPYGVLVILPRLQTLDPAIAEAARDLGAGEITAFVRVTLPLILPAILSSYLISFTISFDEYAIASFLVPPGHDTFPIFLYSNARNAEPSPSDRRHRRPRDRRLADAGRRRRDRAAGRRAAAGGRLSRGEHLSR